MKKYFLNFALICCCHFLVDFMLGVWPVYKTLAKLDLTKAGIIAGLGLLFGEGAQVIFGYLGDRGFKKKLAAIGLLLTGSLGFLAFTNNYLILFFLVLSLYFGSSAFHPSAIGLIKEWSEGKKGQLILLFFSFGALGAALSQMIFTKTYLFFGEQTWILFIPVTLLSFFVFFLPLSSKIKVPPIEFKQLLVDLIPHKKKLSLLFLIQMCNQTMILSLMFLLPDLLLESHYPAGFVFGGGHLCFVLGTTLLSIPISYLVDRHGEKSLMLCTAIGGAIVFYLFLMVRVESLALESTLLLLTGGLMGVINPIIVAAGSRIDVPSAGSLIGGCLMGLASCMASFAFMATVTSAAQLGPITSMELIGLLFLVNLVLLGFYPSDPKLNLQFTSVSESP